MKKNLILACAFWLSLAEISAAATFSNKIDQFGDWYVGPAKFGSENSIVCAMSARRNSGNELDIYFMPGGRLEIQMKISGANFRKIQEVPITIFVGSKSYLAVSEMNSNIISWKISDYDTQVSFLKSMRSSDTLTAYEMNMSEIISFPIAGAEDALGQVLRCSPLG